MNPRLSSNISTRLPVSPTTRRLGTIALIAGACAVLAACQSAPTRAPLTLAPSVDVDRYMGDWYVIGNIPAFIERNAYDAVERYRKREDGRIDTVFSYRESSFEAPLKTLDSVATVTDTRTNAIWGVQFIWPIQADYRIMRIAPDYSSVVVGREKRDYVWIMSRTPTMPEAEYQRLVSFVAAEGYDTGKLRKVPQRPAGSR